MDPPADPMPFEEAPLTWLAGFPFRTVHRFGPVSYLGAAEDAREGDEPLRAAVVTSNEVTILFMAPRGWTGAKGQNKCLHSHRKAAGMKGFGALERFFSLASLKREFQGLLRTRRAFWLLVLTVVLSCLLPLLSWPGGSGAMDSFEATGVVWIFLLTQLTLAILIIPAFTAGAISGERERGTYELLYSTLLSPLTIVVSKVVSSVGYVILLLVASAPAVFVLYLLGGVKIVTIVRCYLVTFAAVLLSGLVCLTQSMRSRRTSHAVFGGMLWVVFWNGGHLLLLWLLFSVLDVVFGGPLVPAQARLVHALFPDDLEHLLPSLSPYLVIAQEVFGASSLGGASTTTREIGFGIGDVPSS